MFVIRQSRSEDVGTLLKLARMVYFINLPPDERLISAKIQHSRGCFLSAAGEGSGRAEAEVDSGRGNGHGAGGGGFASSETESDVFMFTIEEIESGGVVGTSQIKAHMGGKGRPNYSFQLFSREFHSPSLGIGTKHLIARLYEDESGPTEIGGLIIQPAFRGHRLRPGRFLSFVRFHFMALHRARFADRIIAEMMAQITSDGDNLFWDHIGRKFIPVKYAEADRFCQHNRKFIDELLPKDDIYLTLLPLEVLNQVGQVGPETVPARRMLERLGFEYRSFIDPFDGGPHLEARTDKVPIVRDTRAAELGEPLGGRTQPTHRGIVSVLHPDGEFRAIESEFAVDRQGRVAVTPAGLELLMGQRGTACGYTPLERAGPTRPTKARKRAKA